jgi:hypothetical protein
MSGTSFLPDIPPGEPGCTFTVKDGNGDLFFESGRVKEDGSIHENNNDLDPQQYEAHYQVIDNPNQVQIYEVIFLDSQGDITTGLLSAYEYVKDNRLLPAGFDKPSASTEVAVYGEALDDPDFSGGSDRLSYQVDLIDRPGPYSVSVQVLYQTIAYRWMENLRSYEALEIEAMVAYYDSLPNLPVVVAELSQMIDE